MRYQLSINMLLKVWTNIKNNNTSIRNIYRSEQQQLLSFDIVRPLGHNGTCKSVKVPIFPLALNAAVADFVTARTPFKFLSFFRRTFTVIEQTLCTLLKSSSLSSLSILTVSRNLRRIARSFIDRSGSESGLDVGSSKDTGPCYLNVEMK